MIAGEQPAQPLLSFGTQALCVGAVRHASHFRCGKPRPNPEARPGLVLFAPGIEPIAEAGFLRSLR